MHEIAEMDADDPRRQWVVQVEAASDLKPRAKVVARVLATYMNHTLRCRPGVPNIARESGYSLRTVAYALVELRRAHFLRKLVKGHKGWATLYRGRLPKAVTQTSDSKADDEMESQ